jgi:protein disulfide-isomerase A6
MKACLALALAASTLVARVSAGGATALTADSFDDAVFNSGKNAFIKFYAPWCGHCKAMAPDWNKLADDYADSSSVLIADVDCTVHQAVCSKFGVSGYPTVKYFKDGNKEGAAYNGARKLADLKKFTEETLEVSCLLDKQDKCSAQEKEFMAKWGAQADKVKAELVRLQGMSAGSMKPELKKWLNQRIAILKQFAAK